MTQLSTNKVSIKIDGGDVEPKRLEASKLNGRYSGMFWWKPQADNWFDFIFTNLNVATLFVGHLCATGFSPIDVKYEPAGAQMTEGAKLRSANDDDHTDILTVLEEVAPEIPTLIDTDDTKEKIKTIIAECCASAESMVAVDGDGKVVGFVLAKPDRLERFLHKNKAISLRYIGVSKDWRERGIFADLMAAYTAKKVPLTASVLAGNQSSMVRRLTDMGFAKVDKDKDSNSRETELRWQP
jgi:N-acetylglutamate synthase-like GNAT family acetyltransferase